MFYLSFSSYLSCVCAVLGIRQAFRLWAPAPASSFLWSAHSLCSHFPDVEFYISSSFLLGPEPGSHVPPPEFGDQAELSKEHSVFRFRGRKEVKLSIGRLLVYRLEQRNIIMGGSILDLVFDCHVTLARTQKSSGLESLLLRDTQTLRELSSSNGGKYFINYKAQCISQWQWYFAAIYVVPTVSQVSCWALLTLFNCQFLCERAALLPVQLRKRVLERYMQSLE